MPCKVMQELNDDAESAMRLMKRRNQDTHLTKRKEYEPRDPEARYWFRRFKLRPTRITRVLTPQMCEWLRRCSDDSARRILLFGVGKERQAMRRTA